MSDVHAGASQNDVEVHSVDTDGGVVLDAQIDVLLDAEAEVAVGGEVLTTELVLTDLQNKTWQIKSPNIFEPFNQLIPICQNKNRTKIEAKQLQNGQLFSGNVMFGRSSDRFHLNQWHRYFKVKKSYRCSSRQDAQPSIERTVTMCFMTGNKIDLSQFLRMICAIKCAHHPTV